jgi:uncharacterized SAM-binding protein YcdF (DUF218 family)
MATTRAMRRPANARRPRHRYAPSRRSGPRWRRRGLLLIIAFLFAVAAWAILARHFAPMANTARTRFDAIVVLGSPADADGNLTPNGLARVSEGVAEYERGVAPRILFTGGAVANQFVESDVMARAAEAQGIPASAIVEETHAKNTIQNVCYVARALQNHGWKSAEVVSSESHLPRVALIFSHYSLQYRMHAAPPMVPATPAGRKEANSLETLKTIYYLLYSSWAEPCAA